MRYVYHYVHVCDIFKLFEMDTLYRVYASCGKSSEGRGLCFAQIGNSISLAMSWCSALIAEAPPQQQQQQQQQQQLLHLALQPVHVAPFRLASGRLVHTLHGHRPQLPDLKSNAMGIHA